MLRKLTAMAAAAAFAFTALAPVPAAAQHRDHRDYRGDYGHYDHRRGRHHRDDDNDDALAAGVVGLVLGLAIGSLASQPPPQQQARCYDNYQRCAPPPQQGYYDQRYPDNSGLEGGYDPRHDNGGSAYQQDYGYAAPQQEQCTRRERQWDRYANRYLMVDVPC